jgi:hypothetical protein
MWRLIAWIVSRPRVADWLIKRAMKTPYTHIMHPEGVYMERYWLFNPYPPATSGKENRFPISIRIHHICLPDKARDLHDHPWNARTIILKGGYWERRKVGCGTCDCGCQEEEYERVAGDTAKINFGEFHTIDSLREGGAWTLFITGKYRGTWGFLVNGVKIQWRKYTGYQS